MSRNSEGIASFIYKTGKAFSYQTVMFLGTFIVELPIISLLGAAVWLQIK